jgi:diguanylate cyclase (GGDEF)-like protein/PAS domain S-box-containing protein
MKITSINTMGFTAEVEEALRISDVAFETNDAIMITDADANIIRVNQAFLDTTGYSSEEVIGQNPRMMNSGRHDKAFYTEMWQQLLNTGLWTGEVFDKRKNGEIYPKWVKITAVKNELQQITHYVAVFKDLSERKKSEEEIRNLAFYDALTKLPNRHLFLDRFRSALTSASRLNSFGAILLIDLDRFKLLNDTLGHDCGDLILIEVASRLKSSVREMDTVARLGADEFIVLIEDVSDNMDDTSRKVGLVAEKIRESLASPYYCNGHPLLSSPSIGVSLYRGNEKSVDVIVQHADMAMYQAKSAGRNSIRFFDPVMQNKVAAHASLEHDLRHAITQQQLHLYYQMQVDNHNRPLGAEALLRWIHPVRGLVLPGIFIPVAEESALILEIGHWVLDTACRQLALWADSDQMRELVLAVNVSAKQFAVPDFVAVVADVLKTHQVNPSRLKLELTESVMLEDMAATINKMHALKALGVTLAMDDFGIGYSSLSYLKQLPLDQLKIDQGFVQGITKDGSDAMLVQTIIDLATNFRLNVIAEGVETEAQLVFLKHHDCMAFQGFLFGKALPVKEFEQLLHRIVGGLTGSFRIFKPEFLCKHHE